MTAEVMDKIMLVEGSKTTQEHRQHSHEGGGTCVDIHVLGERVKALQERLMSIETAFPRTSVGTPAFDKHRDYHEEEDLKLTRVKQIQHELTKKIIVVIFGALASALLSGYSDDIGRFMQKIPAYVRELKPKQLILEGGAIAAR